MQKASMFGSALVSMANLVTFTALLTAGKTREYRRFDSPDKRYALIVYWKQQIFVMPGQATGAAGYVVLVGPKRKEIKALDR